MDDLVCPFGAGLPTASVLHIPFHITINWRLFSNRLFSCWVTGCGRSYISRER